MSGRLLVLTDGARGGRNGLAMPFRDATVIALEPGNITHVEGEFDNVVVDRTPTDVGSLDAAVASATGALRPDGHLVVMLPATRPTPRNEVDPAALDELVWQGLATLNGQPCAVLRRRATADGSVPSGPLFAAADLACWLASPSHDTAGGIPNARRMAAAREIVDLGRDEQVLLRQIDTLRNELEAEHRRHRGLALVTTVLASRRSGRVLLKAIRKGRGLAARLAARR